jgi:hypothetical protein
MNMVLLEHLGTDFTLHEVLAFPERSFGSSSKRVTEAPESQAIAGLDWQYMGPQDKVDRLLFGAIGVAGLAAIIIPSVVKHHKEDKQ